MFTTLLAARLLGARRSWVATAQAALLGWAGGNLIQCGAAGWTWDAARLSVATVSVSTVLTMLAAVTMDFLARPGSLARGERAGLLVPPHPLRDIRRALAPYACYRQLVGIARANGLALPVGRRAAAARRTTSFGESLRTTLEQGGAVFVKLGQMASTRDDLLPASLRAELSQLQGAVEPLPREPMQAHLEAELGGPVEEFFAEFDWQPIGSASIAQAFVARLATGDPVVVKVQRPGIEALVERDTAGLLHLAGLVERRTPQGRDLRVAEMAEAFTHSLRQELDFPLVGTDAGDLALERALSRFLSENIGPGRSMTGAFNNLSPLLARFDIRLPSDLTLFFRSLVLLDGTARTICPGTPLSKRCSASWANACPPPPAPRPGTSWDELLQQLPRLRRLPAQVDRIATLAGRGDLRARIALFSTEADARVVTTLVNRFVLAGIGGSIAVASAILLTVTDTADAGTIQLTRVFGYVGLAVATVLLLRVVAGIVRDGYN